MPCQKSAGAAAFFFTCFLEDLKIAEGSEVYSKPSRVEASGVATIRHPAAEDGFPHVRRPCLACSAAIRRSKQCPPRNARAIIIAPHKRRHRLNPKAKTKDRSEGEGAESRPICVIFGLFRNSPENEHVSRIINRNYCTFSYLNGTLRNRMQSPFFPRFCYPKKSQSN